MLDLFVWFLWWLCKIEVLNILPQFLQGSLLLNSWFFRLKMPCHVKIWSIIHSNNLYKQIIPVFGENKIAKAHRKTQENNFEWKVQPSTLVLDRKSFGCWLNIGWNPAWGGCAILFLKFWHSETSYCTAIGRWLWAVVCWLYYVDQGGQYWNFDKKNTPERPRHTLGCGL